MKGWQDRYHLLLKNLPDAFSYHRVISDRWGNPIDYSFVEVNHAFEEMIGIKREKLLGRRASEVLSRSMNRGFAWNELYRQVVLKGEAIREEKRLDPLSKWFEITAYSDAPEHMATIFRDITAIKGREEGFSIEDERLLSFTETMPAYIVLLDRGGMVRRMNRAMLYATGHLLEDVIGSSFLEVFVPSAHRELLQESFEAMINQKRQTTFQCHIRTKDGRELVAQWNSCPFFKEDSSFDFFYGIGIDISGYKQLEYKLQERNTLSLSLSKAPNLEEMITICLESALRATELDCGAIYLFDEEVGSFSLAAHRGISKSFAASVSCFAHDSPEALMLFKGRPIYTHGQELGWSVGHAQQKEKLRAVVILPILFEDQVIASFHLASRSLDLAPAADMATLESIGAQMGSYIALMNAVKKAEEREKKYRAAFEGAHDAIIIGNQKGEFLDCNEKALELFGLKGREDFKPFGLASFSPIHQPDGRKSQEMRTTYLQEALKGEPVFFEWLYQRSNGERFLAEVILTAYSLGEEMVVQSTLRDITKRKEDEESMRARNRELTSLYALSTHMRAAKDSNALLPILLNKVIHLLLADVSMIILHSAERDQYIVHRASGDWEGSVGRVFPLNQRMEAILFKDCKPYVTLDYSKEPFALSVDEIIGPGVFVPLLSEEKVMGMLVVARYKGEEIKPFSSSETHLLTAIGEMAGNALRRQQLHERANERMERLQALREIDLAITDKKDLNSILETALFLVRKLLHMDAAAILRLYPEGLLQYGSWSGFTKANLKEIQMQLKGTVRGSAILEKRSIFFPNLSQEKDSLKDLSFMEAEGFLAYCAVPLVTRDEALGLLEVFHRKPIYPEEDWFKFLETLAGQIAIAIDNHHLYTSLEYANMELTLAYDATIEGWVYALDLRDEETEGHSLRVTKMTVMLALALGISDSQILHIRRGALLHDIGKMGIPDSILLKPGQLTKEEWKIMRRHPQYAWEMLKPIDYLKPALVIPYCHHEKLDGSGYPRGLKGEEIPIEARIFAVVDVFDALTSDRPYRSAWAKEQALELIYKEKGKHFDPEVVELFLKELDR